MRILVTGDRSWHCRALADDVIRRLVARYGPDLVLVHGATGGVDRAFTEAAEAAGLEVESHPADWGLGRRGVPIRNQAMIDLGADLCLAVHRFLVNSTGTKDCARRAIEAEIPCYLIDGDDARPRRLRAGDPRLRRDIIEPAWSPGGSPALSDGSWVNPSRSWSGSEARIGHMQP